MSETIVETFENCRFSALQKSTEALSGTVLLQGQGVCVRQMGGGTGLFGNALITDLN